MIYNGEGATMIKSFWADGDIEISIAEDRVVEAAIAWYSRPLGAPRYQEYRDLAQACDALIAAREKPRRT